MADFVERLAQFLTQDEFDRLAAIKKGGVTSPSVPIPTPTDPPKVVIPPGETNYAKFVKRITDAIGSDRGWAVHEYSTIDFFNCTGTYGFVQWAGGGVALHDGITGAYLRMLPYPVTHDCEPRWSRTDPNVFYFVHTNIIYKFSCVTNKYTEVARFDALDLNFSFISGKGEGDLSENGDYWTLCGNDLIVFRYQFTTGNIVKVPALVSPIEGLYTTPDNNVIVCGPTGGTWFYNVQTGKSAQICKSDPHKDVTRDNNGDECLVWTNAGDQEFGCPNGIMITRLADMKQRCLLPLGWSKKGGPESMACHISGANRGPVLVSTYGRDPDVPYSNKVMLVALDGTGADIVCDHHSQPYNDYNWEPKASISHDGSRFVFSSNSGVKAPDPNYSDVFMGVLR